MAAHKLVIKNAVLMTPLALAEPGDEASCMKHKKVVRSIPRNGTKD